jgi:hypothetical protein
MVKFAHLADCHLGGWRQEELQSLNFEAFQKAVAMSIEKKVDFILLAGDLFDSAYPPIEILKETFAEFRKIKEAQIPVFIIAGSHDFSASGKTFLDVLEKAGFCRNVERMEVLEDGKKIKLHPYLFNDFAIYGYSGKKSSLEIEDLKKVFFAEIHPQTIFMLHTTIQDVVGNIPMEYIDKLKLPIANYYALGHIHKRFCVKESNSVFCYPGPIFPNNFQELQDLKHGSFNIVELENGNVKFETIELNLKEVAYAEINIENGLTATEKVIQELDRINLKDKIVLLRLAGVISQGKSGDIKFDEIEDFVMKKKSGYSFLRNLSSLKNKESEIESNLLGERNVENVEQAIIEEYVKVNPADFNKYLSSLMNVLSVEKNEDEKEIIFENRLMSDLRKVLNLEGVL